jgi:hypothetical protein
MSKLTIEELQAKLIPLVGTSMNSPKTKNKGETGILLEKLTGIPQTPNCLDCVDGELKTFPLKRDGVGRLVPKETIAVTMLDRDTLKDCPFAQSRPCKKMSKMLCVPYERTGDTIVYYTPVLIDLSLPQYQTLVAILQADYEQIQKKFVETGELSSSDGTLLQNRTKGAGHGSTSRAFYLRTDFVKKYLIL